MKKILLIFIITIISFLLLSFNKNDYIQERYDSIYFNDNNFVFDINKNENYIINFSINKENIKKLNKNINLQLAKVEVAHTEYGEYEITESLDLLDISLITNKILFKKDNNYYIKIKIIKWNNNINTLYILRNDKKISENDYKINLDFSNKKNIDLNFNFNTNNSGSLSPTYNNYDAFYLSNIYNVSLKNIMLFNENKDFLDNKLDYTILNDNYSENKHKENTFNVKLTWFDFLDNRKITDYKITTDKNIKKYLIGIKKQNNSQEIKIFVSYDYLLKENDFETIKNLLFPNTNIFLEQGTLNEYIADSYTIGSSYTIRADLQKNNSQDAIAVNFDIEIVNKNIFNNSSEIILVKDTKKAITNIIYYVLIAVVIVVLLVIILKVRKVIKRK